MILRAIEQGINYFDAAYVYGESEINCPQKIEIRKELKNAKKH